MLGGPGNVVCVCISIYLDIHTRSSVGCCWVTQSVGPEQLGAVGGSGTLRDGAQEAREC